MQTMLEQDIHQAIRKIKDNEEQLLMEKSRTTDELLDKFLLETIPCGG